MSSKGKQIHLRRRLFTETSAANVDAWLDNVENEVNEASVTHANTSTEREETSHHPLHADKGNPLEGDTIGRLSDNDMVKSMPEYDKSESAYENRHFQTYRSQARKKRLDKKVSEAKSALQNNTPSQQSNINTRVVKELDLKKGNDKIIKNQDVKSALQQNEFSNKSKMNKKIAKELDIDKRNDMIIKDQDVKSALQLNESSHKSNINKGIVNEIGMGKRTDKRIKNQFNAKTKNEIQDKYLEHLYSIMSDELDRKCSGCKENITTKSSKESRLEKSAKLKKELVEILSDIDIHQLRDPLDMFSDASSDYSYIDALRNGENESNSDVGVDGIDIHKDILNARSEISRVISSPLVSQKLKYCISGAVSNLMEEKWIDVSSTIKRRKHEKMIDSLSSIDGSDEYHKTKMTFYDYYNIRTFNEHTSNSNRRRLSSNRESVTAESSFVTDKSVFAAANATAVDHKTNKDDVYINKDDKDATDNYEDEREQLTEIPTWFIRLFRTGGITVELTPTFPKEIGETTDQQVHDEFTELANANFSITLSARNVLYKVCYNLDDCQLKVVEHISFPLLVHLAPSIYSCSDIPTKRLTSSLPLNRSTSGLPFKRSTSGMIVNCSTTSVAKSIANFDPESMWRKAYTFSVNLREQCRKRRVSFTGLYIDAPVDHITGKYSRPQNSKHFRLVFIQTGNKQHISGVYRRQMTSCNKFMTWKFKINH